MRFRLSANVPGPVNVNDEYSRAAEFCISINSLKVILRVLRNCLLASIVPIGLRMMALDLMVLKVQPDMLTIC